MFYIKCFFVYSIFGFLFESITSYFRNNSFSSGILYGPWTPIYGVGSVIILLLSKFVFFYLHWSKWREGSVVFLLIILILTFLEWFVGIMIEKVFNIVFWNYQDFQYHIGKYIAVEVSLIWGLLSIILVYFIHPLIDNFIILIPNFVVYILIMLILIDMVFSCYKLKNRKN